MIRSKLHSPALAGYEESMSPYYAAARLWLDAIIDPLDTRTWISMGIEAAQQAPATREFNMGVFDVGGLGVPLAQMRLVSGFPLQSVTRTASFGHRSSIRNSLHTHSP